MMDFCSNYPACESPGFYLAFDTVIFCLCSTSAVFQSLVLYRDHDTHDLY